MVNHLPTMQETQVQSLDQEDLLEKEMATHSSILPGKSHRWKSLVIYNSWGHKELDRLNNFTFFLSFLFLCFHSPSWLFPAGLLLGLSCGTGNLLVAACGI